MASLENHVWSDIVRTRFDRRFDEPIFALAEMDLNGIPANPQPLHFTNRIPVHLLMELTADDPLFNGEMADRAAA